MIKSIHQLNQEFLSEQNNIEQNNIEQNNVPQDTISPDTMSQDPIDAKQPEEQPQTAQPAKKNSKKAASAQSIFKDMLFLLIKIALIMLTFAALFTFLFGLIRYQDPSMSPAIKDGDLVVFHRYTKSGYLAQDVIALKHNGQTHARRVIATAGDTVDITEEGLYLNGSLQHEPEIYQITERYEEGISFPLTVPEGHVFVLGDARPGATDSRIYGTVAIEDTLGKVMAVIRRRSI